jgi:hypothetical protein
VIATIETQFVPLADGALGGNSKKLQYEATDESVPKSPSHTAVG